MRTTVVLPAPLGPSSASTVPTGTVRSTPSSAVTSPYRLTRPVARIPFTMTPVPRLAEPAALPSPTLSVTECARGSAVVSTDFTVGSDRERMRLGGLDGDTAELLGHEGLHPRGQPVAFEVGARIESHRIVHSGRRWYVVAWDFDRADWRRSASTGYAHAPPPGRGSHPPEAPDPDLAGYTSRGVPTDAYRVPLPRAGSQPRRSCTVCLASWAWPPTS